MDKKEISKFVEDYLSKVNLEEAMAKAIKSSNFILYMKAEFDKNTEDAYKEYHKRKV
jgi:hypothetical protein